MPSRLSNKLNRPVLASVNGAEAAANTRCVAAINISIDYEQILLVDTILATFRLQDPAQAIAPFPRLALFGLEGDAFANVEGAGATFFTKKDESKLTYNFDSFLTVPSFRLFESFNQPLRLTGLQFYSFGFGAVAVGAALAGYEFDLEVMGRIVNAKDFVDFPWKYR